MQKKRKYSANRIPALLLIGLLTASAGAAAQETVQQKPLTLKPVLTPAEKRLVLAERDTALAGADSLLASLIQQPAPGALSKDQLKKWRKQTEWLRSVRRRLAEYHGRLRLHLKQTQPASYRITAKRLRTAEVRKDSATVSLEQLQAEFLELQNSLQMESRQYQGVSNYLRVRHDTAMGSIRNMR